VPILEFTVPAVPVAQPRARASTFNGKVQMHTPTSIKQSDGSRKAHPIVNFKATVRMAFKEQYSGSPLMGPLRCDLTFVMPRPKAMLWKTRAMPRTPHDKKPDRDNLDKAFMDALKGLAWLDDAQVCQGEIQKWIASGNEQPHVRVRIETLEF